MIDSVSILSTEIGFCVEKQKNVFHFAVRFIYSHSDQLWFGFSAPWLCLSKSKNFHCSFCVFRLHRALHLKITISIRTIQSHFWKVYNLIKNQQNRTPKICSSDTYTKRCLYALNSYEIDNRQPWVYVHLFY